LGGCPSIIHTGGGKEFINKIAKELYGKLNIKGSQTSPEHPQFNSQGKVFNKTLAKYMKNVVDESTQYREWYLAPLMFFYNTSYHRTINTTPLELTSGMKPRLPAFPTPEFTQSRRRICSKKITNFEESNIDCSKRQYASRRHI
jgi:hypothetical protein